MPTHQPLRNRCNAPSRVYTEPKPATSSSKAGLNDRYDRQHDSGIEEVPRSPHDPSAPRQFVPYLYLSSPLPSTSASAFGAVPAGAWTHILRLIPATKMRPAGTVDLSADGRSLDIYVPSAALNPKGGRTGREHELHLSPQALLIARDFLTLALPYYASTHPPQTPGFGAEEPLFRSFDLDSEGPPPLPEVGVWTMIPIPGVSPAAHTPLAQFPPAKSIPPPSKEHGQADPVRVLVLGPPRLTLAIALVYIAHASGCSVRQVIRGVLEAGHSEWCVVIEDSVDGRMGLGEKELRLLEETAADDL